MSPNFCILFLSDIHRAKVLLFEIKDLRNFRGSLDLFALLALNFCIQNLRFLSLQHWNIYLFYFECKHFWEFQAPWTTLTSGYALLISEKATTRVTSNTQWIRLLSDYELANTHIIARNIRRNITKLYFPDKFATKFTNNSER